MVGLVVIVVQVMILLVWLYDRLVVIFLFSWNACEDVAILVQYLIMRWLFYVLFINWYCVRLMWEIRCSFHGEPQFFFGRYCSGWCIFRMYQLYRIVLRLVDMVSISFLFEACVAGMTLAKAVIHFHVFRLTKEEVIVLHQKNGVNPIIET